MQFAISEGILFAATTFCSAINIHNGKYRKGLARPTPGGLGRSNPDLMEVVYVYIK